MTIPINSVSTAQPVYQVDADPNSPTYGQPIGQNGVGGVQTPTFARVTNSATIAAGKMSVTVANVGSAVGTLLGTNLKPGENVSFSAGDGATLTAIAYNASGTEFILTTVA